ncbi:MAG: helix-turn-helix domain-containing protein [Eggerthellaceae bacterium]|nr:helix-turn-helix domain-containing protein [Eggerthellaceae bacterium]
MEDSYNKILRSARISKNIGIDNVARNLKIRADIVNTLEEGDFEHLPSTGFTRNMVFSYARFLGLDGAALSQQYLSESNAYFSQKKSPFWRSSSATRRKRCTRTDRSAVRRCRRERSTNQVKDSTEVSKDPAVAGVASSTWTAPSFYEPNRLEPKQIQSFGHVSTRERFDSSRSCGGFSRSALAESKKAGQTTSICQFAERKELRATQREQLDEAARIPADEEARAKINRQSTRHLRQAYSRFNNRASYDMRNEGYSGADDPNFDVLRPTMANRQKAISSSKDQKNLGIIENMNSILPKFKIEKNKLTVSLIALIVVLLIVVILNMTLCAPKIDIDRLSNLPISGLTDVE